MNTEHKAALPLIYSICMGWEGVGFGGDKATELELNVGHLPKFPYNIFNNFLFRWVTHFFEGKAPHWPFFGFLSNSKYFILKLSDLYKIRIKNSK